MMKGKVVKINAGSGQRSKAISRRPKKYQQDTGIKKRPLIFVDLEFSGLELDQEVIEIGCLVVDQKDMSVQKEWLKKIKLAKHDLKKADKNSLAIIGYTQEKWADAVSLQEAMTEFNNIAKDGVLVGYNVAWDFMFLEKSFFELGIKPAFHWQIIDVLSMCFYKFYKTKAVKGMRMKEVEKFLKIKHGDWHNPLDDAKATFEIYLKLIRKN